MNAKKVSIKIATLALLFGTLSASGCAAMFNGKRNAVDFNSTPANAKIYIDGQYRGTTPATLDLVAKRSHSVKISKDGYKSKTTFISKSIEAGWVVLDVLAGGIVALVIDGYTDSWFGLDTDSVFLTLEKSPQGREESTVASMQHSARSN